MVMRLINNMLRPIRNRITLMVSRAVITLLDDETMLQQVQARVLGGELLDGIERFQQYGFTSVPHPGAEAITLSVGGHRSHTVVINVDDRRYRLKGLKGGEVALYTDEGDFIHFQRGRIAKLKVGKELILDTPLVRALGKIKAADDILDQTASDNVRTVREMREVYNGHNHPESGGGTTGNPNQEQ